MVRATLLWTTLKLVVLTLPAASVAVRLKLFVPATRGTPSTHTLPPRSTSPFTVCTVPSASGILQGAARRVVVHPGLDGKAVPADERRVLGQSRVRAGGVVSPLVSNT